MANEYYEYEVLLDTETADWQKGRAYEWTRLIQFALYKDGKRIEELVVDLHPDSTCDPIQRLHDVAHVTEVINGGALVVIQNARYDIPRVAKLGIHVQRFRDTQILSQLLNAGKIYQKNHLNDIMRREIGFDPYEAIGRARIANEAIAKLAVGEFKSSDPTALSLGSALTEDEHMAAWIKAQESDNKKRLQASDWAVLDLTDEQWEYARMDVSDHFYQAWRALEAKIGFYQMQRVADLEHAVLPAVIDMEQNGIKMHMDKWDQLLKETASQLADVEERLTSFVDAWTQELYPEKFMITLRRKAPREAVPERWSKGKAPRYSKRDPSKMLDPGEPPALLRAAIPAQEVGDLASRQPTPELFTMRVPSEHLLALQHGDYRVGSVVWQELGQVTTPENMTKHRFNLTSMQQMRMLVNDIMGVPYHDSETGEILKDMLAFGEQDIVLIKKELQRRQETATGDELLINSSLKEMLDDHLTAQGLRKLLSTYGESYQKHADEYGYIRSNFSTTATATGRMASTEPNLQNLPREWQAALFCCEHGEALISVDYSNMEGRTQFYVTGQMDIYEKLTNGMDLHSLSTSFVLNCSYDSLVERIDGETKDTVKPAFKKQRQNGKKVTFAPMFACGAKKIAELLDISERQAYTFLNNYWNTYPITRQCLEKQFKQAMECGYITDLSFGRRRFFEMTPDDRAALAAGIPRDKVLGKWKAEAYNYSAQAGGASCIKVATVELRKWIDRHPETKTVLRLEVHDAIKVTCAAEYAEFVGNEIKRIMEIAAEEVLGGARVPADVEIHYDCCAPRTFMHNNKLPMAA